jgi:hypothetical protein
VQRYTVSDYPKEKFWAWRTDNPDRIETPQQISIYAHPIWQRKSPVSEAIARKLEQVLPVGRISNAPRSIAERGLRSVIPFLCPNLLPLSVACGHGRACWQPDPVANDPRKRHWVLTVMEPKMPKITCEVYKDPHSTIFVVLCKHGDDVLTKFAVRSQEEGEAVLVRPLRQLHENSFTLGNV